MPRISEFHGIAIYMYVREHPPPHFHAEHGDDIAVLHIETGEVIAGKLPVPKLRLCEHGWINIAENFSSTGDW